jgi:hypothetical protein
LHHFNWSPGIGDPTIAGWVTVGLYFAAALGCWRSARRSHTSERHIWAVISVLFVALGFNKQLDLQSALTELGRVIAFHGGWYERRQSVQLGFVIIVATISVGAIATLFVLARRTPIATWVALLGTAIVLSFVLIRAASFHHVDRFIGSSVLGFRWNWILEMGGIIIVLLASLSRGRTAI